MIPFDREFTACRTIDSLKPLKIDSHIENFENFVACGIYLDKKDGLTYWTKHAFTHALNEKKRDQNIIDSQLERITDLSATIEHYVHDYYNPTFRPDVLEKKAEQLTYLVASFEKQWGLKLANKRLVWGGYKSRMCFARYVDQKLLNKEVNEAIELNKSANLKDLVREYKSKVTIAAELSNSGCVYLDKFFDAQSKYEKDELIRFANAYLKKAADMGDRKAQYKIAKNYEKGHGLNANMDIALVYYRMSAESNYSDAQMRLAEYYDKGGDAERAMQWYKRAANHRNHPSFDACMYLGYYYDRSDMLDDKKEATRYFMLAKDNIPADRADAMNKYRPCYLIGMEHMRSKNYSEAAKWFERISGSLIADVYCGDCYLMLGKKDEAVTKYLNVDKDKLPDDRRIVIADHLLESEETNLAYEYYSRCKNVDSDPRLRSRIADCYVANGDTEGAIKIYEKCIEENGDLTVKKKLADILFDQKKYSDVLEYYLEYSKEFFCDDTVTERIGDCYRAEQNDDEAFAAYMRCLDAITDTDKLTFIANMLIRNGESKKAFDIIDRLISGGECKIIPIGIIEYIEKYNKWERLAAWYGEHGCTLSDDSLVYRLGNYYRLIGDDRAIECYECYADYNPIRDSAVISYMIRYYKSTGNGTNADMWITRRDALRDVI